MCAAQWQRFPAKLLLGNFEMALRRLHVVLGLVLLVNLAACGDTWSGFKKDTGENLEKTGQTIEKAGEKIKP